MKIQMPSECFKRLQQWTGVGQGSLPQGHPPTKRGRGRNREGEEEGAHQKDVVVEVFAVCVCLHRCHRFWSLNLTATASRTTRAGRKGIKGYTEYTQTHTHIYTYRLFADNWPTMGQLRQLWPGVQLQLQSQLPSCKESTGC